MGSGIAPNDDAPDGDGHPLAMNDRRDDQGFQGRFPGTRGILWYIISFT